MTGRFCWYELLARDVDAARTFYQAVFSWRSSPVAQTDGYALWMDDDGAIGGLRALPESARSQGAPPNWLGHLRVENVEEIAGRMRDQGATVLMPPASRFGAGKFALTRDPQGAVVSVLTPGGWLAGTPRAESSVVWHELNTTDYAPAWTYYSSLFGWSSTGQLEVPGLGPYQMFEQGGMSSAAAVLPQVSTHWLYYFKVPDIDGCVRRITDHGGRVLNGPMQVPSGNRVAQCEDAEGAAFAVSEPAAGR